MFFDVANLPILARDFLLIVGTFDGFNARRFRGLSDSSSELSSRRRLLVGTGRVGEDDAGGVGRDTAALEAKERARFAYVFLVGFDMNICALWWSRAAELARPQGPRLQPKEYAKMQKNTSMYIIHESSEEVLHVGAGNKRACL